MVSKPRHIVFITPGFAANEADSTCMTYLQIYFKALLQNGYKLSIISLHYPYKKGVYYWNNCEVYSFTKHSKWEKPLLWLKAIKIIQSIHKSEPVVAIHSFWLGECALIGEWVSKKIRVKHINTLMGQDVLKGNWFSSILPIKKMNLVALSTFHQQVFLSNYKVKAPIVHFGVSEKNAIKNMPKTIDFIGVGALIPLKNYSLFIDIINEINKKTSVKAIIIGEGIEFDFLSKKIQELKLGQNIQLLSLQNYEQVLCYLAQSKILLHTSQHEGFGMIFAEALQQKTMVVSTPVGSIFESPNAILENNKNDLIIACQKMLARTYDESFSNPFKIEKTIEEYNKYYQNS